MKAVRIERSVPLLVSVVIAVTLSGCVSSSSSEPVSSGEPTGTPDASASLDDECEVIAPAELPSGEPAGDTASFETDDPGAASHFEWGEGPDRVVQAVGSDARAAAGEGFDDVSAWPESSVVRVDGEPRLVLPVGDPGQIQIHFVVGDCYYVNWVGPGMSIDEARDYAARM